MKYPLILATLKNAFFSFSFCFLVESGQDASGRAVEGMSCSPGDLGKRVGLLSACAGQAGVWKKE